MGELFIANFKTKTWAKDRTGEPQPIANIKSVIEDASLILEAAHDAGFQPELGLVIIPNEDGGMIVQQLSENVTNEQMLVLLTVACKSMKKVIESQKSQ